MAQGDALQSKSHVTASTTNAENSTSFSGFFVSSSPSLKNGRNKRPLLMKHKQNYSLVRVKGGTERRNPLSLYKENFLISHVLVRTVQGSRVQGLCPA